MQCRSCVVMPTRRASGSVARAADGASHDRVRSCGAPLLAEQRFCGQCGAAAGAPPAAGQRFRPTSASWPPCCSPTSSGFTSLPSAATRGGRAHGRRRLPSHGRRGRRARRHVDKYTGDSLMAVFGVPQAHEDDAERAVTAALGMRQLGGDLALSIGVNSGPVMVTSVGRDGDLTVIGDTVNVAARLEKAAAAARCSSDGSPPSSPATASCPRAAARRPRRASAIRSRCARRRRCGSRRARPVPIVHR